MNNKLKNSLAKYGENLQCLNQQRRPVIVFGAVDVEGPAGVGRPTRAEPVARQGPTQEGRKPITLTTTRQTQRGRTTK